MSKLNVVNGMAMLSYLQSNNIDLGGEVVPFNEGMCDGCLLYTSPSPRD